MSTLATRTATRAAVCAEACSWLGTPYHHCADIKGAGVDCAMLLVRVFTACGLVPASLDPRPYAPDWNLHRDEERFLGWLQQHATPIDQAALLPGDVLCWRFGRCFAHGAIYLGDGEIVHAYRPARAVVRGWLSEPALADRPVVCFRVHGIEGQEAGQ